MISYDGITSRWRKKQWRTLKLMTVNVYVLTIKPEQDQDTVIWTKGGIGTMDTINNFRRDENKDQNSNRGCCKCQKIGHISRDCPQHGNPAPRGDRRKPCDRPSKVTIFVTMDAKSSATMSVKSARAKNEIIWVIDTGAKRHRTYRLDLLSNVREEEITCALSNNTKFKTTHVGDMKLKTIVDGVKRIY
jgi:hypothetical protein